MGISVWGLQNKTILIAGVAPEKNVDLAILRAFMRCGARLLVAGKHGSVALPSDVERDALHGSTIVSLRSVPSEPLFMQDVSREMRASSHLHAVVDLIPRSGMDFLTPQHFTQEVIGRMSRQEKDENGERGSIVYVTPLYPDLGPHFRKHALTHLRSGVRMNIIVNTEGARARPVALANAALLLASPLSAGIAGNIVHADCGAHLLQRSKPSATSSDKAFPLM